MSTLSVTTLQGLASSPTPTKIEVASGHTLHAPGHVIQVVRSGNFTSAHVNGTSSSYATMGSDFSLAITPKFSNSVILIEAALNPYTSGSNNSGTYNISKDGGSSFIAAHDTNGFGIVPTHGTASGTYSHFVISCSDTVSSTSTVTYQIYFRSDNNGVTFYGNHQNMSNHITLMEIAQ